ncbi:MAG TPA: DNA-3-methyladenine glycosylase [Gemmatimonadaceae bacterium]|nr:DNA-3-methyladenine glycosylase [Gemmatimonadaceae bacterium]
MGRILSRDFYDRETEIVAREMLGAIIECSTPEGLASAMIVETEAYIGEHDLACHAAAGRTRRTSLLYGPPGFSYVYFIYGMHWCFNAVTRAEGMPSAVLVRAVQPVSGKSLMRLRRGDKPREIDLTNGPGKLCEALGITGAMNGISLRCKPLVIREGRSVSADEIETTPRIGISRAVDWPLRYIIRGNPYVSRFPRANLGKGRKL